MSFYRKDRKVGQHWSTCTCKTHKKLPLRRWIISNPFVIWGLIVQTLATTYLVRYMHNDDYSKSFMFYNNPNLWWGPWLWDRRKKSRVWGCERRAREDRPGPGAGAGQHQHYTTGVFFKWIIALFRWVSLAAGADTRNARNYGQIRSAAQRRRETDRMFWLHCSYLAAKLK